MNSILTSKPKKLDDFNLQQSLETKYYFIKAKIKFILANLLHEEPIFIYQMGRVGSVTIFETLTRADYSKRIYHSHFLTREGIDFFLNLKLETFGSWRNIPASTRYYTLQSLFLSQELKKRRNNSKNKKKLKVITLVRDPIATNISGFFHNKDLWLSDFNFSGELSDNTVEINNLKKRFLDEYPHEYPLTWFDRELKLAFNMDVFADSFPKSIGYKIYEGDFANVLLLKLESIDRCINNAFKDFMDIDVSPLMANTSNKKVYSTLYKKFVAEIQLPETYIEKMYNSYIDAYKIIINRR